MAEISKELTGEEAKIYDRQIRLWGLEAQRRMAGARVLVVGAVESLLGSELCKNVALAGVGELVLCGTPPGLPGGYLGADVEAVVASLRETNPLVKISTLKVAEQTPIDTTGFAVVCFLGFNTATPENVAAARESGAGVFVGDVYGLYSALLVDLGPEFVYRESRWLTASQQEQGLEYTEKTIKFPSYASAFTEPWTPNSLPRRPTYGLALVAATEAFVKEHNRPPHASTNPDDSEKFSNGVQQWIAAQCENNAAVLKKAMVELAPKVEEWSRSASVKSVPASCAMLGGVWGREVIKAVTRKDEPINNFFFFDGTTQCGLVETYGTRE